MYWMAHGSKHNLK